MAGVTAWSTASTAAGSISETWRFWLADAEGIFLLHIQFRSRRRRSWVGYVLRPCHHSGVDFLVVHFC